MNTTFKISILVPIYGVERFIEKCATSLLEQDYENIEYVFVNDCTPDKSINVLNDVIKKYPARIENIKIINHKTNKGLSAARNTALENSTGEYILPFDSDDFLTSRFAVSELVALAIKENSDVVFYDMQQYPGEFIFSYPNLSKRVLDVTKSIIERNVPMSICGGLYRKSIFIDNNIRSIQGISMGEDYAIKPRLIYFMKNISYLPKPFYGYRWANDSSITKKFNINHVYDLRQCIDGFYSFFEVLPFYDEILPSIKVAEIKCKAMCLDYWAHCSTTSNDFKIIQKLFPSMKHLSNYLTKRDLVFYKLASYNLPNFIKFLVRLSGVVRRIK